MGCFHFPCIDYRVLVLQRYTTVNSSLSDLCLPTFPFFSLFFFFRSKLDFATTFSRLPRELLWKSANGVLGTLNGTLNVKMCDFT